MQGRSCFCCGLEFNYLYACALKPRDILNVKNVLVGSRNSVEGLKGWAVQGSNSGWDYISYLSLLQNVLTLPGAHPVGTRFLFWGQSGRGVNLTTYLRQVPRVRMGGAIPLLHLYAFMAWTRKTTFFGTSTASRSTLDCCL